jgi:hypothetical protein
MLLGQMQAARHSCASVPATCPISGSNTYAIRAGIGSGDPNPGANTLDRYQSGHQPTLEYLSLPFNLLYLGF